MRQAFAGMLWGKQLYAYDVDRWLAGDPGQPPPPASRRTDATPAGPTSRRSTSCRCPTRGSTRGSRRGTSGFHCVTFAHLDPQFAKYQLLLLCREWFQHPNGALPAYEWDFGDVNPPVQAWAALEVFAIDGARDVDFLERVFDKLLVNFTWWVNLEDADGSNLFEGGFLGLDNIGPIDRSHLPVGGRLEQSDATGWMAFYSLTMAAIASILNRSGTRSADDLVLKFLEHFAAIGRALEASGVWDEEDGFFYDQLIAPDGTISPVKVRSMVGVIPLLAAVTIDVELIDRAQGAGQGCRPVARRVRGRRGARRTRLVRREAGKTRVLFGVPASTRLERVLARTVRSGRVPLAVRPAGVVGVAPRPPVPTRRRRRQCDDRLRARRVDHLDVRRQLELAWPDLDAPQLPRDRCDRALRTFFGDELQIEYPTGSGVRMDLWRDRRRPPATSHRAVHRRAGRSAAVLRSGRSAAARSALVRQHLFNEYFHGDDGAGLGATHQTGWTGLVADLIRGRPGNGVYASCDRQVVRSCVERPPDGERPDMHVPDDFLHAVRTRGFAIMEGFLSPDEVGAVTRGTVRDLPAARAVLRRSGVVPPPRGQPVLRPDGRTVRVADAEPARRAPGSRRRGRTVLRNRRSPGVQDRALGQVQRHRRLRPAAPPRLRQPQHGRAPRRRPLAAAHLVHPAVGRHRGRWPHPGRSPRGRRSRADDAGDGRTRPIRR